MLSPLACYSDPLSYSALTVIARLDWECTVAEKDTAAAARPRMGRALAAAASIEG